MITNPQYILRALIVYGICLPLAVVLGYVITNPLDLGTFLAVGLVLLIMSVPILLRFHRPLMLFAWNSCMVVFFLPGRPQLWVIAIFVSFMICIGQMTLDKRFQFISAPSLKWPLIAMIVVVVATAKATGGIGIRSLGGDVYGGKRYVLLLCAILGYFALSAERIPPGRANLYVGLYFLGAVTSFVSDLFAVCPPYLRGIFLLFPPNDMQTAGVELGSTRMGGFGVASAGAFTFMMAKYGVRGIFTPHRPWRAVLFIFFVVFSMLGGYRSTLIAFVLTFLLMFFLEGLHRSRLLPVFVLAATLVGTLTIAFLPHLPFTFQRALAFLPLEVDPVARQNAEMSSEWRLQMWKAVLPQVPHYLLVGKGYGLSHDDYELTTRHANPTGFEEQWGATLAGDYHNGPLSVIIPFGIWGALAFLWFLVASWRVLVRNHRYGDPALDTINTLLLAAFIVHTLMFFVVVGGLNSDMLTFSGVVGLSVALNGGVARPAPAPVPETAPESGFATILPRARSVFSR